MKIFADSLYAELTAAADSAGANRIYARLSWVREQVNHPLVHPRFIQPGDRVAMLRCSPPPCIELWAVPDYELSSEWEAVDPMSGRLATPSGFTV